MLPRPRFRNLTQNFSQIRGGDWAVWIEAVFACALNDFKIVKGADVGALDRVFDVGEEVFWITRSAVGGFCAAALVRRDFECFGDDDNGFCACDWRLRHEKFGACTINNF